MIFGIFGKFGIEIGTRKKKWSKKFSSKKIRKLFRRTFFGTKKIRFLVEKFFVEKINENLNFSNFEFFRKKIEINQGKK